MTRRVGIDAAMGRLQAYRAEGQVTASGPTQIASGPLVLNQDLWNEVRSVNDRVNRAILRRSDKELYGVDENWTLPLETGVNAGDCEDFVLEKRRALLEAGVPQSALSIAVVTTYRGVSHAVLLLSTDRGDYVLDSLTPWILPWAKTDYHWEERQVAGSTEQWASLSAPEVVKRTADGKAAVLLISL
jgi:predicted transglutaminase-like cysteine proteinase